MADTKISQLVSGTQLNDADFLTIVQNGVNKKITSLDASSGFGQFSDNGTDLTPRLSRGIVVPSGKSITVGETVLLQDNDMAIFGQNVWLTNGAGLLDNNTPTAIQLGSATDVAFTTQKKSIIGAVNEVYSKAVRTVDDQTVGGVKTFTSNPVFSASTASTVLTLNGSKAVTSSVTTVTELSYVSGVTSSIQTQLNGKEPSITPSTTDTWYRGDKTFRPLPVASTSNIGITQLSNSFWGSSEVVAVTEKALKDGLASVGPGPGPVGNYWILHDVDSGYLAPQEDVWEIRASNKYVLTKTTNLESASTGLDNVSTFNPDYTMYQVVSQALVHNAKYNSGTDAYTFHRNAASGAITGFVRAFSLGSYQDFAYYNSKILQDAIVPAQTLYHGTIIPAECTFAARFNLTLTANYSIGLTTFTAAQPTAYIQNGVLCLNGAGGFVHSQGITASYFSTQGTVKAKISTNYSGYPANNQVWFYIASGYGPSQASRVNAIELGHRTDGYVYYKFYDNTGILISSGTFGLWSSPDTSFREQAFCFNFTTGNHYWFVNGQLLGTLTGITGNRGGDVSVMAIGSDSISGVISAFRLSDLVISREIEHTSSYTPGYSLAKTYLKGGYNDERDYYFSTSMNICANLGIGQFVSETSALSASFNTMASTSFALGVLGMGTTSFLTLNGQYLHDSDQFFIKAGDGGAYAAVFTSGGGDALRIYSAYKDAAVDSAVDSSTVITQSPAFFISKAGIAGGIIGPKCLETVDGLHAYPYGDPVHTTTHAFSRVNIVSTVDTSGSVVLPLAKKGMIVTVIHADITTSPANPLMVWASFGDWINQFHNDYKLINQFQSITFVCATDGHWWVL